MWFLAKAQGVTFLKCHHKQRIFSRCFSRFVSTDKRFFFNLRGLLRQSIFASALSPKIMSANVKTGEGFGDWLDFVSAEKGAGTKITEVDSKIKLEAILNDRQRTNF